MSAAEILAVFGTILTVQLQLGRAGVSIGTFWLWFKILENFLTLNATTVKISAVQVRSKEAKCHPASSAKRRSCPNSGSWLINKVLDERLVKVVSSTPYSTRDTPCGQSA